MDKGHYCSLLVMGAHNLERIPHTRQGHMGVVFKNSGNNQGAVGGRFCQESEVIPGSHGKIGDWPV